MRSLHTVVVVLLSSLGLLPLAGCHKAEVQREALTLTPPEPGKRITSRTALVVRGMNYDSCNAGSIGAGSNPQVGINTDVQNLSVNCSEDPRVSLNTLAKKLPNDNICWAKLEELEARGMDIKVVTDPIPGNEYHCLVSGITPTQMVQALHFKKKKP